MPDNTEKIEHLNRVLESGTLQVSVGGVTTIYRDRQSILNEIRRLKQEDSTAVTSGRARTINLGGF